MDFSIITQLRMKKVWWMDVILYLVVSLFIAAIFCYLIFMLKASIQVQAIKQAEFNMTQIGTEDQKTQENEVLVYKRKIADFNSLFTNHKFASNVFGFMQEQTLPYVWFKRFTLDQKNSSVQLTGTVDSMDNLSRQVANFEKNKYVQKVGLLNSTTGPNSKIDFSINVALDPKIFNYLTSKLPSVTSTTPTDTTTPVLPDNFQTTR